MLRDGGPRKISSERAAERREQFEETARKWVIDEGKTTEGDVTHDISLEKNSRPFVSNILRIARSMRDEGSVTMVRMGGIAETTPVRAEKIDGLIEACERFLEDDDD